MCTIVVEERAAFIFRLDEELETTGYFKAFVPIY
jgi:hypothetical protein